MIGHGGWGSHQGYMKYKTQGTRTLEAVPQGQHEALFVPRCGTFYLPINKEPYKKTDNECQANPNSGRQRRKVEGLKTNRTHTCCSSCLATQTSVGRYQALIIVQQTQALCILSAFLTVWVWLLPPRSRVVRHGAPLSATVHADLSPAWRVANR